MSETATKIVGVAADIDLIRGQIAALRDLASDPDKAADSARVYDFSIRWGAVLSGRLERLEHYHRRGELSPDDEARYAELRGQLRDILPLAERLDVGRPTVPLEDAGARR